MAIHAEFAVILRIPFEIYNDNRLPVHWLCMAMSIIQCVCLILALHYFISNVQGLSAPNCTVKRGNS